MSESQIDEANLREEFKFDVTKDVNVLDRKVKKLDRKVKGLKMQVDELGEEVIRDPLTNAYNRRFFDKKLEELTSDPEAKPFALILIDIDNFKQYNNRYGHDVGDAALRHTVKKFESLTRVTDFVCRLGGDELAVILTNIRIDELENKSEYLKTSSSGNFRVPGQNKSVEITFSLGASHFDPSLDKGLKVDDLIKKADKALYQSKEAGRNRVTVAK